MSKSCEGDGSTQEYEAALFAGTHSIADCLLSLLQYSPYDFFLNLFAYISGFGH